MVKLCDRNGESIVKRVSCIITTYNRSPEIVRRAIDSVNMQTYPVTEIIVVDDNKDEDYQLSALIRRLCDTYQNVKYIKQNGNKGACAARNLGIKNAIGDYIGILDEDDEWLPKKIARQIESFESNSEAGMVYCGAEICHEPSKEVTDYYNTHRFKNELTLSDLLLGDKIGCTSIPLIRRSVFDEVGYFWEEQPARQDYEMWIRISEKYKIVGVEDVLFRYYLHEGDQISKNKIKSYWGFRNIYSRYKKYYEKNNSAKIFIMRQIWINKYQLSLFDVKVFFFLAYQKLTSSFFRLVKIRRS